MQRVWRGRVMLCVGAFSHNRSTDLFLMSNGLESPLCPQDLRHDKMTLHHHANRFFPIFEGNVRLVISEK